MRLLHRLDRGADRGAATPPLPLDLLQHLLVPGMGGYAALYSSHLDRSSVFSSPAISRRATSASQGRRRPVLGSAPCAGSPSRTAASPSSCDGGRRRRA